MYTLFQNKGTPEAPQWTVFKEFENYLQGLWTQDLYNQADTFNGKFILKNSDGTEPEVSFYKSLADTVRYAPIKPKLRNNYEVEVYGKGIEAGLFKAICCLQMHEANTGLDGPSELLNELVTNILDDAPYVGAIWKEISTYNVENYRLNRELEELREKLSQYEKYEQGSQ